MCDLQLIGWQAVNSLSRVLIVLGSVLSYVKESEYTRSFIEARYFGVGIDGIRALAAGKAIEDDEVLEDTIQLLDRYGYLDSLNGEKEDIVDVRRAFNKVFVVYSDDETEDVTQNLERMNNRLRAIVVPKIDSTLNWVFRIGFFMVVSGVVCMGLYHWRGTVDAVISSIPC